MLQPSKLLLGLCLGLAAWEARVVRPQIDDAYISYRYAQNLVEGHGLLFNVGERVEGITNLLWTLLLAAAGAAGIELPLAAHALGALSGAALLGLSWLWVREYVDARREWLAGLAALAVWSSSAYGAWVISGLETPLFAALVLAALFAQARGRLGVATGAALLATFTRPEGVLLAAALYAAELGPWLRRPTALLERRERWLPAATYASGVLALTAFRLAYYGDWLPNTFHAKVGGIPLARGLVYVRAFALEDLLWLCVPMLAAVAPCVRAASAGGERARAALAAGAFVVLLVAYSVAVGGDTFFHGRFLLPALPLLVGLACAGIDRALARDVRAGVLQLGFLLMAIAWPVWSFSTPVGVVAVLALGSALLPQARAGLAAVALIGALALAPLPDAAARERVSLAALRSERRLEIRQPDLVSDAWMRGLVDAVVESRPPPRLVAAVAIGRLGYWSRLPILDLVGLVDVHIAHAPRSPAAARGEGHLRPGHQRSDPDYVLSRRPDFIFIPREGELARSDMLPAVLDLWDDPRLARDYVWNDGAHAYERRDRAAH